MSPQYGELRPTNGWDPSGSLRHPCIFQRVSLLGSITAWHLVAASAKLCRVEQRAPPVFGRATITLGIGPHSSLVIRKTVQPVRNWYCLFLLVSCRPNYLIVRLCWHARMTKTRIIKNAFVFKGNIFIMLQLIYFWIFSFKLRYVYYCISYDIWYLIVWKIKNVSWLFI